MNLRGVLFEAMWHASSNRVAEVKQTSYRKPWFAGKAAQRMPALTEYQSSSLARLPKAEPQPNAPGLWLCFLYPEGFSSRISRYSYKQDRSPRRLWTSGRLDV